jgi:predicted nucleotidyltransferase
VLTTEQYPASIVEKYHVVADTGSASHRAADKVIPLVKQWGKQYLLGITLSGAHAKNTAVSLSSDVDVLIALNPVPNMEMKGIFWGLFEYLTDYDLRPHTRNVSIQLEIKGHKVDLIPACRDRESSGNVLFNKRSGATVHTDLAQHVHLVANSGRQQEICAVKIWRERSGLDFPSLYLELTVLHALAAERFGQLADNVLTVLRYISNRFEPAVVRDPANSDNIVSNDLSAAEKKAIAKAARDALYDENWKKILW